MVSPEPYAATKTFLHAGERDLVHFLVCAAIGLAGAALFLWLPLDPDSRVTQWLTSPMGASGRRGVEPEKIAELAERRREWEQSFLHETASRLGRRIAPAPAAAASSLVCVLLSGLLYLVRTRLIITSQGVRIASGVAQRTKRNFRWEEVLDWRMKVTGESSAKLLVMTSTSTIEFPEPWRVELARVLALRLPQFGRVWREPRRDSDRPNAPPQLCDLPPLPDYSDLIVARTDESLIIRYPGRRRVVHRLRAVGHHLANWLMPSDRPPPQVPDIARFELGRTHFRFLGVQGQKVWSYTDIQDVVVESLESEDGTTNRLLIVTGRNWNDWTATPLLCAEDDARWLREVILAVTLGTTCLNNPSAESASAVGGPCANDLDRQ